jgi:hypothetical protein
MSWVWLIIMALSLVTIVAGSFVYGYSLAFRHIRMHQALRRNTPQDEELFHNFYNVD